MKFSNMKLNLSFINLLDKLCTFCLFDVLLYHLKPKPEFSLCCVSFHLPSVQFSHIQFFLRAQAIAVK